MIALGLDPSLTGYGWCVIDTEKKGRAQVLAYGVLKSPASVFFAKRYADLREGLRAAIAGAGYAIDFVGVEHPPFNASYSSGLYALYVYTCEVLMDLRLPFVTFLPTQLKAFARDILGDSGKMFKADMKNAMKKLLDNQWKGALNNNVADAYLIAYHAARFKALLDGAIAEGDLSPKEQQAMTWVHRRKNGEVEEKGLIFAPNDRYFLLRDPKYDYLYG